MSDLIVGEMLVLVLILPVLARPFIPKLRNFEGICLLPSVAFVFTVCILFTDGLSFSVLPAAALSLFVFIVTIPRLIKYIVSLPTDFFSIRAIILYVCMILLYLSIIIIVVKFAPEPYVDTGSPFTKKTSVAYEGNGRFAFYTIWSVPNQIEPIDSIVLILHDAGTPPGSRSTAASMLASNGYLVLEASYSGNCGYSSIVNKTMNGRRLASSILRIVGLDRLNFEDEDLASIHRLEIERMLEFAKKNYGDDFAVFVLAEGSMASSVQDIRKTNPEICKGIVYLSGKTSFEELSSNNTASFAVTSVEEAFHTAAFNHDQVYLTAPDACLFGLGEIGSDDVLQAELLGGDRDENRRIAELAARKIVTWFNMRSLYDSTRP